MATRSQVNAARRAMDEQYKAYKELERLAKQDRTYARDAQQAGDMLQQLKRAWQDAQQAHSDAIGRGELDPRTGEPYAPGSQVDPEGTVISNPDGSLPTGTAPGTPIGPDGRAGGGGAAPGTDPTAVDPKDDNPFDEEGFALIKGLLAEYGLEELSEFVRGMIVKGAGKAEIELALRGTDQFKKRFRAIEARRQAGKNALTPGEIINYENQARAMLREAALPEGFYDTPDDFADYLINDVSIAELGERIAARQRDVFAIPAEARSEFRRLYNLGEGDLTAYFLDPTKALPVLKRRQEAGIRSGAAIRAGFGSLNTTEAERLVDLGVSEGQAQQGFGTLMESRELFTPIDLGEDVITREEQVEATFSDNAAARQRIQRRQRRRQATFQSGGSFTASQGGLVGLGTAEA